MALSFSNRVRGDGWAGGCYKQLSRPALYSATHAAQIANATNGNTTNRKNNTFSNMVASCD